ALGFVSTCFTAFYHLHRCQDQLIPCNAAAGSSSPGWIQLPHGCLRSSFDEDGTLQPFNPESFRGCPAASASTIRPALSCELCPLTCLARRRSRGTVGTVLGALPSPRRSRKLLL